MPATGDNGSSRLIKTMMMTTMSRMRRRLPPPLPSSEFESSSVCENVSYCADNIDCFDHQDNNRAYLVQVSDVSRTTSNKLATPNQIIMGRLKIQNSTSLPLVKSCKKAKVIASSSVMEEKVLKFRKLKEAANFNELCCRKCFNNKQEDTRIVLRRVNLRKSFNTAARMRRLSWRQLIISSLLIILLTSFLASFNPNWSPASSCAIFSHCHALSPSSSSEAPNLTSLATIVSTLRPRQALTTSASGTSSLNAPTASPQSATTPTVTSTASTSTTTTAAATTERLPPQTTPAATSGWLKFKPLAEVMAEKQSNESYKSQVLEARRKVEAELPAIIVGRKLVEPAANLSGSSLKLLASPSPILPTNLTTSRQQHLLRAPSEEENLFASGGESPQTTHLAHRAVSPMSGWNPSPQTRAPEARRSLELMRRQFLPTSGSGILTQLTPQSLLQSVVRGAVEDMFAAHGKPAQNEQIFSSASGSRPLILSSPPSSLLGESLLALLPSNYQQQEQPSSGSFNREQAKMVPTASQSAPSIALPPLSHLLVPRNPFRLFASHSTPIVSRYRPNKSQAYNQNHQVNWPSKNVGNSNSLQTSSSGAISNQNQLRNFPMISQAAYQLPAGLDMEATNTKLYANSQSVEQLEKLVRAASKAGGYRSSILPAIVQAPTGASFPGFYIPALEGESELESQVNEFRHNGESAAASASTSGPAGGSSALVSKIPGTDYVLHPDEVRAMINIGELAWRNQNQNQQQNQPNQAGQQQQTAASASQQQAIQSNYHFRNQANFMSENHAENARDFAYVDPGQNRRDQYNAQASHQLQSQQIMPNYNFRQNNSELERQLNRHFNQNQINTFPAIIRLDDQDYVHWPLVRPRLPAGPAAGNRKQPAPSPAASGWQQLPAQHFRQQPAAFHPQTKATYQQQQNNHQESVKQETRLPAADSSQAINQQQPEGGRIQDSRPQLGDPLEYSPVRLATQLTPSEIQQVEDSIIEALIMAQTLQHQRRVVEAMASNPPPAYQKQQPANNRPGFMASLFGRRKRRHSANQSQQSKQNNQNFQSQGMIVGAPSAPHFISMLPVAVNLSGPGLFRFEPAGAEQMLQLATSSAAIPTRPLVEEFQLQETGRMGAPTRILPVVMADQETNKPTASSGFDTAGLLTDDSAPKATFAKLLPVNSERNSISFGSRLPKSNLVEAKVPTNPIESPKSDSNQFDDDDNQNDMKSSSSRPGRDRMHVDWPAMASDADYFPPADRKLNSWNQKQTALPAAQSSSGSAPLPVESSESRLGPTGTSWPLVPVPVATPGRRGNFVSSQLKLQFAQDYQSREGVPIYNNNVRVAGALDRQRQQALESIGKPSRQPVESPSPIDNEEEEAEEDLEEAAAASQEAKAKQQTNNKLEAASKQQASGNNKSGDSKLVESPPKTNRNVLKN